MGATNFTHTAKGKTPEAAFRKAVDEARSYYGNRGYTGSIAEKSSFVLIKEAPKGPKRAYAYANKLIDACDPRIDDKWGPAGCIEVKKGTYLFFGWAST